MAESERSIGGIGARTSSSSEPSNRAAGPRTQGQCGERLANFDLSGAQSMQEASDPLVR
jgi:hypothetical protein